MVYNFYINPNTKYDFILESGTTISIKFTGEIQDQYRLCDAQCTYLEYECYGIEDGLRYICFFRDVESNMDEPVMILKRPSIENPRKFDFTEEVYLVLKNGEILFDYEAELKKVEEKREKHHQAYLESLRTFGAR